MKLIIAGSRSIFPTLPNGKFDQVGAIRLIAQGVDWVESEVKQKVSIVISGRAIGPDRYGELWAKLNHVPILYFPADWSRGLGAGYDRNKLMAQEGDVLLAVWDQKSGGTSHMIGEMKALDKPVYIKHWTGIVY